MKTVLLRDLAFQSSSVIDGMPSFQFANRTETGTVCLCFSRSCDGYLTARELRIRPQLPSGEGNLELHLESSDIIYASGLPSLYAWPEMIAAAERSDGQEATSILNCALGAFVDQPLETERDTPREFLDMMALIARTSRASIHVTTPVGRDEYPAAVEKLVARLQPRFLRGQIRHFLAWYRPTSSFASISRDTRVIRQGKAYDFPSGGELTAHDRLEAARTIESFYVRAADLLNLNQRHVRSSIDKILHGKQHE